MLTLKESKDKKTAQAFLDARGVDYTLNDEIVMACEERGQILGVSALSLRNGKVYLDLLVMAEGQEDMSLQLGLAKSMMNLADLRGITEIYGANKSLEQLYQLLRFQQEEEEYCLSLEGYFTAEHK